MGPISDGELHGRLAGGLMRQLAATCSKVGNR